MPDFKMLHLPHINLRAAIQGQGPLVVLVHGFPESWYSWRHQMSAIAEAGFTACAIDVRGYGGSDKPQPVEAYAMAQMVEDIAAVIALLTPDRKAVLIGHDWGAAMVWNAALIRSDRVRAVAALSVPYLGVPAQSFRALYEAIYVQKGRFFYQHYFQAEGVAEAELEADPRDFLRRFYYALSGDAPVGAWPSDKRDGDPVLKGLIDPTPFPAWMTPADLDYYTQEFEGSGFRGPLNRYRNHDADFAYLSGFKGRRIKQPALFIGGDRDLVLSMLPGLDLVAMMKAEIPDLRGAEILAGCGHWTQQERPAEVNARLIPWLKGL